MEWAQETIARLRFLWDEGHSTREIGSRLGVSKNSVVGKAHRLDLPSRPTPIKRLAEGEAPKRPYKERMATLIAGKVTLPKLTSLQEPAPTISTPRLPKPAPKDPRPVKARPFAPLIVQPQKHRVYCNSCQWIEGERKPFLFCDEPATRGAYCAEHAERAYVRPRDRREDEYKIAA